MNIIRKAKISADKRSIDAYGRSIELAIVSYLLDNGKFPTSIDELTIEYTGDEVVCSTTNLNSDSSIYLAGCTVGGRSVEGYAYGSEQTVSTPTYTAYEVGDEITYNNVNYYVIKDSSASEETVTLLKAEPLTYEEITTYSAGTGAQTSNQKGYGGMQYHSSSSDYSISYVKTTVDAWKDANAQEASEARLIAFEDLTENLGFELQQVDPTSQGYKYTENTPSWAYNASYWYWTMSRYNDSSSCVCYVDDSGVFGNISVDDAHGGFGGTVRPVIVLPKSALN